MILILSSSHRKLPQTHWDLLTSIDIYWDLLTSVDTSIDTSIDIYYDLFQPIEAIWNLSPPLNSLWTFGIRWIPSSCWDFSAGSSRSWSLTRKMKRSTFPRGLYLAVSTGGVVLRRQEQMETDSEAVSWKVTTKRSNPWLKMPTIFRRMLWETWTILNV